MSRPFTGGPGRGVQGAGAAAIQGRVGNGGGAGSTRGRGTRWSWTGRSAGGLRAARPGWGRAAGTLPHGGQGEEGWRQLNLPGKELGVAGYNGGSRGDPCL